MAPDITHDAVRADRARLVNEMTQYGLAVIIQALKLGLENAQTRKGDTRIAKVSIIEPSRLRRERMKLTTKGSPALLRGEVNLASKRARRGYRNTG